MYSLCGELCAVSAAEVACTVSIQAYQIFSSRVAKVYLVLDIKVRPHQNEILVDACQVLLLAYASHA